jgi:hypothetical protein
MSHGVALQASYTFAKSIMLHGMDFNNQFDFSNTHAASLLDQRHRFTPAGVYEPRLDRVTSSDTGRALPSGWRLSGVMEFSSGPSVRRSNDNESGIHEFDLVVR